MSYKIIISVISVVLLVFVASLVLIAIENNKANVENNITPVVVTPEPVQATCFIGGCSSEICSDQPGVISNCIYKEEFACYKTAQCERQADGQCGWTQTVELTSCLMGK